MKNSKMPSCKTQSPSLGAYNEIQGIQVIWYLQRCQSSGNFLISGNFSQMLLYRQKCIFRKFATISGFVDNSDWHLCICILWYDICISRFDQKKSKEETKVTKFVARRCFIPSHAKDLSPGPDDTGQPSLTVGICLSNQLKDEV